MKLKEFWKSKKGIAIHCDTEEKAEKLCKAFDQMGQKWNTGCSYLENDLWHYYETESCYTNRNIYSSKSFYEGFDYRIIPFEEIEDFQTNEIHLTQKGKEVHAVYKADGKVVDRKKAVCSPEDEFDFGTGARIAFNRLQINKDFADSCALEKKERTKNIANPIDLIAEIISKLTVPCKNCKWYYNEVCCNRDSDWVADFPPEYSSCKFGELKED